MQPHRWFKLVIDTNDLMQDSPSRNNGDVHVHERGPLGHSEAVEQSYAVIADCSYGKPQFGSHALLAVAFGDQLRDLSLSLRQ